MPRCWQELRSPTFQKSARFLFAKSMKSEGRRWVPCLCQWWGKDWILEIKLGNIAKRPAFWVKTMCRWLGIGNCFVHTHLGAKAQVSFPNLCRCKDRLIACAQRQCLTNTFEICNPSLKRCTLSHSLFALTYYKLNNSIKCQDPL